MIELRDYQQVLVSGVREKMRQSVRRPLMVAPTGAGKTVMAGYMQGGAVEKGHRTWFTVHRREIIERTAETFVDLGIDFGIVLDGYAMQPHAPVQICGVQTLVNRLGDLPKPDGVIWDEAHHIVAGDHAAIAEAISGAWQVGMTATPERLDGAGLGPYFDELVIGPGPRDLIRRGFLSPYRYFAPGNPDLFGMNMRQMAEAMGEAKLIGDAVGHWFTHAEGMRTLGFEMNRRASEANVAAFRSVGVEARHVDGSMHRDLRRELFAAFRSGEITYLSQVAIAGEGVDIPGAECALLRYKSNSLTKYLQDCGRVLRPLYEAGFDAGRATDEERVASIAAGPKPWAAILDMGGNAFDFGMPCDDRTWSLQGAKERRKLQAANDAIPIRQCPMCFRVSPSSVKVCPGCDYEHSTVWTPPSWAAGELFELGKVEAKANAAVAKEMARKREKDEERGASLATLIRLASERNKVQPGRYADARKWALMKITVRADYAKKFKGRRRA